MRIFNFCDNDVRVFTDENGEPWFMAVDVCTGLGISDAMEALSRLDDDVKGGISINIPGVKQELLTINESGLYSLVMSSRKPEAKPFKKWLTGEVLPTIRKNGGVIKFDISEK